MKSRPENVKKKVLSKPPKQRVVTLSGSIAFL